MGFGVTASDPCLADVFRVCSFLLFTIWVTPGNQFAKLALRDSSVLTQDFRGSPNGCPHLGRRRLFRAVHRSASRLVLRINRSQQMVTSLRSTVKTTGICENTGKSDWLME